MRQIILAINALLKFKAYTLINVLGPVSYTHLTLPTNSRV